MFNLLKKQDKQEQSVFSRSFSGQVQESMKLCAKLADDWEIVTCAPLPPSASTAKLKLDLEKGRHEVNQTNGKDKFERLLVVEIDERLRIMGELLRTPFAKNFEYEKEVSCLGVRLPQDAKMVEERLKRVNVDGLSGKWIKLNSTSYSTDTNSENEIRKVKLVYRILLKESFGISAPVVRSNFKNADRYADSVEISLKPNSSSFERKGTICLNVYNTNFINLRHEPTPNVFQAAKIVGEEGLLGHQGNTLMTRCSNIPEFMKYDSNPIATVSAECLGALGASNMVKHLRKNPSIFRIPKEDQSLLSERLLVDNDLSLAKTFSRAYGSYVFFTQGRDAAKVNGAISSIINDKTLLSEVRVQNTKAFYAGEFWQSYTKHLTSWGYLLADIKAEEIEKRLGSVNSKAKERIISNLPVGSWTRKGFDAYVEYLFEEFS